MRLKLMKPGEVLVDAQITSLTTADEHGSLTLRPRHIDFTTKLVPSIFSYRVAGGERHDEQEHFAAVDEGVLVKQGDEVLVAVRHGVCCDNLEDLRRTVLQEFAHREEQERKARSVLANLESSIMRRFIEVEWAND